MQTWRFDIIIYAMFAQVNHNVLFGTITSHYTAP